MFDFGFFVAVFAFRARVVDGEAGIGIRISRDIRDGALAVIAGGRRDHGTSCNARHPARL